VSAARRRKGIGPILEPGTSAIVAWAEGDVLIEVLDPLAQPRARTDVMRFNPAETGAVLEAT